MTTDEMILALVASGKFTRPDGLYCAGDRWPSLPRWYMIDRADAAAATDAAAITDQQAHDLCAMHFARRLEHVTSIHADQFRVYIGVGNSAAAIKALYEAMKEQG